MAPKPARDTARDAEPGLHWQARERYCLERRSLTQVAEDLELPERTVRDWAERFGWREEREALAEAEASIRINTVKCRAHVLQKLLDSDSGADISRMADAAAALERLFREAPCPPLLAAAPPGAAALATRETADGAAKRPRKSRKKTESQDNGATEDSGTAPGAAAPGPAAAPAGPLEELDREERIELLERAVNRQLSYVLTNPVDDLSRRVKEIKAALDVLESLKGKEADNALIVSFEE